MPYFTPQKDACQGEKKDPFRKLLRKNGRGDSRIARRREAAVFPMPFGIGGRVNAPPLQGVFLRNRVGATLAVARNAGDGVPYGFYFDPRRPNP